ncbi:MAG: hypothetical protein QNJ13_14230 [Paracoccaceae bacterium]|nr:hypothetical protein [Paracoccaceae bacterium]
MLIALVLGGLAAAMAAPIVLSSEEDDDEDVVAGEPEVGDPGEATSLLDPEESVDLGEIFEIPQVPGAYEIEDFDPEIDRLTLTIADIDATVETGWNDDGSVYLRADTADGEWSVSLLGQTEVPGAAVTFIVPHGDDGEALSLSLAEIMELGAPGEDGGEATRFVLDGGSDHPMAVLDEPLDDLGTLAPIPPGEGDTADEGSGAVDDLEPLAPGSGETTDEPTAPTDETDPVAPGSGDAVEPLAPTPGDAADDLPQPLDDAAPLSPTPGDAEDVPPDPLDDAQPVGPNPGEEEAT